MDSSAPLAVDVLQIGADVWNKRFSMKLHCLLQPLPHSCEHTGHNDSRLVVNKNNINKVLIIDVSTVI